MNIGPDKVGIGRTDPSFILDVNRRARVYQLFIQRSAITTNGADLFLNTGSANTIWFRPNGEGSSTNQGSYNAAGRMSAVSFTSSSDYRIKSNVQPIPDEYTVDNLRPVH